ncbi:DUF3486 family protein [Aeromonas piscicola]|uniref:DUF3486 family protein n=1 Tax=Aeromonas piscicola TaxID=600645 RepID=UPI0005B46F58|nr:DUF3486 family protein [Aeromonas piscicola]
MVDERVRAQLPKSRKSKVALLPPELKEQINDMIRSGSLTQLDIHARLRQLIEEKGLGEAAMPSYTSFNRYHRRMEAVGDKILAGRQMAEVWTAKLGKEPSSDVGKLLFQFVQSLAFETSLALSEGEKTVSPKALNEMALALQRLEAAASNNLKREREIRTAYAEEAANAVTEELRGQDGISEEIEARIREILMGRA